MKKLSILEMTVVPMLVAFTMVLKMQFAGIPNLEVTTPLFIALVALLKRPLGLYYLIIFLIADSILLQNGNIAYMLSNAIVWIVIFLAVQGAKTIKHFRSVVLFVIGAAAVLWNTFFSFWLLSIIAPIPGFGFSFQAVQVMWAFDVSSGHVIMSGGLAVTMYVMLLEVIKTAKIKGIFDHA